MWDRSARNRKARTLGISISRSAYGLSTTYLNLNDRPEMRSLVEELNSTNSAFRSVGCDAWDLPDQPVRRNGFPRDMCRSLSNHWSQNNRREWIVLFNAMNSFDPNLADSGISGLICSRKRFVTGVGELRMSALIELFGWGRSISESRANFRRTTAILQRFFATKSTRQFPSLSRRGRRISNYRCHFTSCGVLRETSRVNEEWGKHETVRQ